MSNYPNSNLIKKLRTVEISQSLIASAVQNYLTEHPVTGPEEAPLTLDQVKADSEIASAISLKHSSGSDNQDLSGLVLNNDSRLSDARTPLSHTHENDHAPHSDDQDLSGKSDVGHTHTWTSGVATKNITDASTVQNIAHGLGRIPKYVRIDGAVIISAAISQVAIGIFDGTNNRGLNVAIGEGTSTAVTDAVYTSTSIALGFSPLVATNPFTGANRQTGIISVDATNIIITWTKTGTVASLTANLLWETF